MGEAGDETRAATEMRLRIDATGIDVGGDDPGTLVWLAEFFEPAFASSPLESLGADLAVAHAGVRFEQSPAEHARLSRTRVGEPPVEFESFTLDGSFERHTGWHGRKRWRWAHDERHDAFYGVDPDAHAIRIVARADRPFPRLALMRVVRELATTALLRSGRLPVHGAAFLHGDSAVLVCGPKRSGKTTLLIHALRCGAPFLSNDRIFVDAEGSLAAQPMPTIVMLRDGSLAFFEELKKDLEESGFDRGRTIAECISQTPPSPSLPRPGRQKRGISPVQLCRLLGAPMRGNARVGLLLFPRVDPTADGIVLERMAAGQARETMSRSLLKPSDPTRPAPLFSPQDACEAISAEVESRQCEALVERVPVYDCRLGPNAYRVDLARALERRDR
jgi:hypothetical protein